MQLPFYTLFINLFWTWPHDGNHSGGHRRRKDSETRPAQPQCSLVPTSRLWRESSHDSALPELEVALTPPTGAMWPITAATWITQWTEMCCTTLKGNKTAIWAQRGVQLEFTSVIGLKVQRERSTGRKTRSQYLWLVTIYLALAQPSAFIVINRIEHLYLSHYHTNRWRMTSSRFHRSLLANHS